MMQFKDKVAIVTGGGTGIGQATAVKLSAEGAKVIIANRSEANALETLRMVHDTIAEKMPCQSILDRH